MVRFADHLHFLCHEKVQQVSDYFSWQPWNGHFIDVFIVEMMNSFFEFAQGKVIHNYDRPSLVMVRLDRTIQKPFQRLIKALITPGRAFWILRSGRRMTAKVAARIFGQTRATRGIRLSFLFY
jgi:hypothetical protein